MVSGQLEALRRYKYLDSGSFMHLLLGPGTRVARLAGLAVSAGILAALARAWWSAPRLDARGQDLLWTATFAFAPVVNLYVPNYDAVLLIPGAVLAARHLEGPSWRLVADRPLPQPLDHPIGRRIPPFPVLHACFDRFRLVVPPPGQESPAFTQVNLGGFQWKLPGWRKSRKRGAGKEASDASATNCMCCKISDLKKNDV